MEPQDLELIEQLTDKDPELKKFWDEHHEYERRLDEFNRLPTSPRRKPWSGNVCKN